MGGQERGAAGVVVVHGQNEPTPHSLRAPARFTTPGCGGEHIALKSRLSPPPLPRLFLQWTYQAMLHELMGLSDGTVKLKNVAKVGGAWGLAAVQKCTQAPPHLCPQSEANMLSCSPPLRMLTLRPTCSPPSPLSGCRPRGQGVGPGPQSG